MGSVVFAWTWAWRSAAHWCATVWGRASRPYVGTRRRGSDLRPCAYSRSGRATRLSTCAVQPYACAGRGTAARPAACGWRRRSAVRPACGWRWRSAARPCPCA
jgi:hypothetical protein